MNMRQKLFNFIFISFLVPVSCSFVFPSPILNNCPFAADLIDYCTSEFNLCTAEKSGFKFCSSRFCDCSKSNIPSSEQHCRDNITDTCRLVDKRSETYIANYVLFELPIELNSVVNDLKDLCKLELNGDKELDVHDLVKMLSTNKCLQENQHKLDDVLNKLSKDTSKDIEIPFDRFRCGWHSGDLGKVLCQYWLQKACGPYSVDVNHCSSKHMNCYINHLEEGKCDEQYSSCRKNLASRMISHRDSCAAFISKSDHEIFAPSLEVYESFKNIKITTQISLFNGHLKEPVLSVTNRDFSPIKVFQLKASPSLDHGVRDKFKREIYKNGWVNRVIIDSCAMIFEDCSKHDKTLSCLKKLVFCLYAIDEKGDEFEMALRDFNHTVSTLFIAPPSKAEIEKMISDAHPWQLLMVFLEYLVFWLLQKAWENREDLKACCCNCFKLCRRDPLQTPEPPEGMEMIERPAIQAEEGDITGQ